MTTSKTPTISELEDEAMQLRRQLAWASGAKEFLLREKLAEVEGHIRFLKREDDPNPAQISLF